MQNDGVKNKKSSNLDKVGIICSGACVLHCMSAPLLALASPVIVSFFENEWIHLLLLVLIVPMAIIAFYSGYHSHEKIKPSLLGGLGVLILLSPFIGGLLSEYERLLTFIGCAFLITGHYFNLKFQKDS